MMAIAISLLTACSSFVSDKSANKTISSSLMNFLYLDKASRAQQQPEIPVLKLPVKVGLAFIPSSNWRNNGIHNKDQIELLQKVKQTFSTYDYIDTIEIIPSTYTNLAKYLIIFNGLNR